MREGERKHWSDLGNGYGTEKDINKRLGGQRTEDRKISRDEQWSGGGRQRRDSIYVFFFPWTPDI